MLRDPGLDFLRGIAIVGMVLSGTISRNPELPGWMFHAQVGPPDFIFNPNLSGITWVDLVFPFFIFAMGMSIPFSLNHLIDKGASLSLIIKKLLFRFLKLWFFAVMLGHLSVFHYPPQAGYWSYLLAALAFTGFFLVFLDYRGFPRKGKWLNPLGYALLISLCFFRAKFFDLPFSLQKHDIIILVLANMALWGGIIWLLSRKNLMVRLAILAFFFGLWLTRTVDGSWNQDLWNYLPLWQLVDHLPVFEGLLKSIGLKSGETLFYNPEFLKYLMIFLPATIAGDFALKQKINLELKPSNKFLLPAIAMVLLVFFNIIALYLRLVHLNFITTSFLLYFILIIVNGKESENLDFFKKMISWAVFWVLLGLIFEAWQGGVKKDPATFSYLFLTTGFSIFIYLAFHLLSGKNREVAWWESFVSTGKNPMLAYVLVSYLIIPLLGVLQVLRPLDQMQERWVWASVVRGLFLTSVMMVITVFSVRKNLFWKT